MDNNDILIRLRYALDIKNKDMVKIFKLGGMEVTEEDMLKMLIKSKDSDKADNKAFLDVREEKIHCNNLMLESFLNGFIIFKRGDKDLKLDQSEKPEEPHLSIKDNSNVNNVVLKKLKIALALTSEDVLDILKKAGVVITKGELGAVLRKEGQKNYKQCGDRYVRNFLKGLALKYRKA